MSIIPDYIEIEADNIEGEIQEVEKTDTTWILDEKTKTIKALSDNRRDCIIQAAYCALRTECQEYEMYSINYGSTLHEKMGDTKPHIFAEIENSIRKCLKFDERINSVSNFKFEDNKGNIIVRFDMDISSEVVQMEVNFNG